MTFSDLADSITSRRRWVLQKTAGIAYDLRYDPCRSRVMTQDQKVADLWQPATLHPVQTMHIIIRPLPSIRWTVTVSSHAYVSVGMVLWHVRRRLRQPIREYEWTMLSWSERDRVNEAFEERCEQSWGVYYERTRGVRGIDLLCGRTIFGGLKPSLKERNVWELVTVGPS